MNVSEYILQILLGCKFPPFVFLNFLKMLKLNYGNKGKGQN